MTNGNIHPTAIIGDEVKIADGAKIGAFCILEGNIEIGEGTILHNNVVIKCNKNSYIKIGKNNIFYPFCVIGGEPQDEKFKGEPSNIEIGDNNVIREYVTINGGTELGNLIMNIKNLTKIENSCYLCISCHIAHDVYVESFVTITNGTGIAGHCKIGYHAKIGGLVGIHQFVNIGHNSMIGGKCAISNDIPPYSIVTANPDVVRGANIVGMKRCNIDKEKIKAIVNFYNDLIKNTNATNINDVISKYRDYNYEELNDIINFISTKSKRGLI